MHSLVGDKNSSGVREKRVELPHLSNQYFGRNGNIPTEKNYQLLTKKDAAPDDESALREHKRAGYLSVVAKIS